MITELRVRDLATVAEVTLSLGHGLNVLTGETGAGKSMLVDAMALLLGARADLSAVRPGAARAVVEGVFEDVPAAARAVLRELGLDDGEDVLIVRREVAAEGRSRAWINGSATTITTLAQVGEHLVDLHGQYETRSLVLAETQRTLLDALAEADSETEAVQRAWDELTRLRAEEDALIAWREDVRRRADYLRHLVSEIDAARLQPGEVEELDDEARRLSQAGTLTELARRLIDAADEGDESATRALGEAERALQALERIELAAVPWRELLDGAYANLTELSRQVAEYAAGILEDPDRLATVERRRDALYKLRQKHGETIEEVLAARETAAAELDLLDTAELDLRKIATERIRAEETLHAAATRLTARRKAGGERLSRDVGKLLPRLGLSGGKLTVELSPLPRPSAHGAEDVHFFVQLNAGLEARPLGKVASGGEVSRLMLALKVALAKHDKVPVLVFDEIDQGIGGEIGGQVGDALAQVAKRHQVLVITHLAQIAARADHHLVVSKRAKDGIATSDVRTVAGAERVDEVARMLGDAEAATARMHAQTLLGKM